MRSAFLRHCFFQNFAQNPCAILVQNRHFACFWLFFVDKMPGKRLPYIQELSNRLLNKLTGQKEEPLYPERGAGVNDNKKGPSVMNIIGLDIGTTSISAAWLDTESGQVKKTYTVANKGFIDTDLEWERIQNAELITDRALELMEEIRITCPKIDVIGLTGQMHGILYVDESGKSVSPLYTWQDGRGGLAENGKSLCQELGEKHGKAFYTGYGLVTHIYNMRHHLVPAEAASFCTIMDYLGMKLTGRKRPLVHSSNAASFGFYDLAGKTFDKELLKEEGVDTDLLPEITSSVEILGSYKGIPVTIAIGDNQASFIGSMKKVREDILINMGTGGQISMYSDQILTGDDIETRPLLDNGYIVVGSTLCGGRAYALLADFFKMFSKEIDAEIDPYAVMDQMLKNYQGKDHLQINTAFDGSRDHPEQRGSITNLTTKNFTPAALTYGVLDGIAEEMFTRYQTMLAGQKSGHIRMIGSGNGMRRNPHLQNVFIQKFGMELELSDLAEEAACGAALAGSTAISEQTWQELIGV